MSSLVAHNMKCTNLLSTMKPKYSIYGNLLFKLSIFEVNLQVAPLPKITAVDSTLTESGPTPKQVEKRLLRSRTASNRTKSIHGIGDGAKEGWEQCQGN